MDHRPRKTSALRPMAPSKRRSQQNAHIGQFLLLMSAGAMLVGSIATWKVYDNRNRWREWVISLASGKGPTEDYRDELEGESVRYRGNGYADLGVFSIDRYNSITNTTLTVEFRLKGTTPYADEASFNRFMHENSQAFRDRVTEAVRECRMRDYTDTAAMGRKVVARVNRAFSSRFLESAQLADLAVYESVGSYQTQSWQTGDEAAAAQQEETSTEGRSRVHPPVE